MASRDALNSWVRALQYKKELDNSVHQTLLSVIADVAMTHGASAA